MNWNFPSGPPLAGIRRVAACSLWVSTWASGTIPRAVVVVWVRRQHLSGAAWPAWSACWSGVHMERAIRLVGWVGVGLGPV
jgi:hypothetical protein